MTVRGAFAAVAGQSRPQDQFVLVLLGHGVAVQDPAGFVLNGPDLDAAELARLLDSVPAAQQVVLNFSASSGRFLKRLAKAGRVNLCATGLRESNESVLAEFFLQALETGSADGFGVPVAGKADGAITLLEAYHRSVYDLVGWIGRQKAPYTLAEAPGGGKVAVPRGDWVVRGKGAVALFRKLYDGPKGEPGAAVLAPESDATVDDEPVELKPVEGRLTVAAWDQRRILPEHAVLEDCGVELGVSCLTPWVPKSSADSVLQDPAAKAAADVPGFVPLDGRKPGDPGFLAGRTVLGRPRATVE